MFVDLAYLGTHLRERDKEYRNVLLLLKTYIHSTKK